jgi:DeoR/GlpR family transcriptional regulator of sugar metabolism
MAAESEGVSSRERRDTIQQLLLERDSVTVRDLAERFSVSAMTVHRDLDALESIGVLRKVRGGATAQPTAIYESSLGFRLSRRPEAKERIAERAAARVKPGASVALDDSTTTLAMLPHLAELEDLTIVTYFGAVVEEVARLAPDTLELIVIGGTYSHKYHSFGGVLAEQQLLRLTVDHSFISVPAVDVERGAFHQELDQAALKRTLVRVARDASLLVDATKFEPSAMHQVVELSDLQAIYTDDSAPEETIAALQRSGAEVHVVAAGEPVPAGAGGLGAGELGAGEEQRR